MIYIHKNLFERSSLTVVRKNLKVAYSYEHGDKSLPPLRKLVSEKPDPEKSRIIDYLRTHCVITRPGIIQDELCPDKTIGYGDIYSDGTYYWNDAFTNYVDRYNIPVPKDFREHILKNYFARKKRHMQLRIVNRIVIQNNPYLGYNFTVSINRNGLVTYQNNLDYTDEVATHILAEDAEYIIDPIMSELFCYDSDEHGTPTIDGYHWKITFYRDADIIDEKEGWEGEDSWRYGVIKRSLEFIERYIPNSLGSEYMK